MPAWKSKLVDAYRLATCPYRAWQMYRRRQAKQVPVFVLFYHRVSDQYANPWTIGCQEFEAQINWIEERFDVVDLEECQRRIRSGENTRPTLSITFDDGYAENSEFALPLLLERRLPVTYFITLDCVKHQKPFPHDIAAGRPLPVHTIESLRALHVAGIEIGAHTRTHCDLGKVSDPDVLVDELLTASEELGDLVGCSIRYFAFPYGQPKNLNASAFAWLKRHGFQGACTTIKGWNAIGEDAFQLSRVHGDANFSRLKNWLSFDPRMTSAKKYPVNEKISLPSQRTVIFPTPESGTLLETSNAISND